MINAIGLAGYTKGHHLGRRDGYVRILTVLSDASDSASWVDMTTDPKKAAEWLLGMTVGRHTALAIYAYQETPDFGDRFIGATILASKDRGHYDAVTREYDEPPQPVEIVNERRCKALGILDILKGAGNA